MWDKINDWVKHGLLTAVTAVANAIVKLISFLEKYEDKKAQKEKKEEMKKKEQNIDDVCDNGTLNDLKDLVKKLCIVVICSLIVSGCKTIEIDTTELWEGHYTNVELFNNSTRDIKLDKNTSIWVLSNHTLKRILKDLENKKN